jgi:hypothetical protein
MMGKTIETLEREMEQAAAALDFEEARRLRDQINLMRGGASAEDAAGADTRDLERQQSGAMGLGTSQQLVTPPAGWTPPAKPNLHTNVAKRRR